MKNTSLIQLVECPRDAMQGWSHPLATHEKVKYFQSLLTVGFPVLDMGSFVSHKAVPQMADTSSVLEALDISNTNTQLLVIVANERGGEEAAQQEKVSWIGFPFSVSESFQQRNTGSSIRQSLDTVAILQEKCQTYNKNLVVYLSMAFGNPYGDVYDADIVLEWAHQLQERGVNNFSLADTVGLAKPEQVHDLTKNFGDSFNVTSFGLHLHAVKNGWKEKLIAGLEAGCHKFDGAIGGIGGCPFAGSELVGNMDTVPMASWLEQNGYETGLDLQKLTSCAQQASQLFIS